MSHTWNFITDFGGAPTGDNGARVTTALATIANAGGGELQIPAGRYPCSTAVYVPIIDRATYQRPLRITGCAAPPTSDCNAPLPDGSGYSTLAHTLTSGPRFFGLDPVLRNNTHIELRDLVFETPNNPQVACIDLRGNNDVILDRVLVYPGVFDPWLIQQPTNPNAFGIALPRNFNSAFTSCTATVWGHYTGFLLGELLHGGRLEAAACIEGIRTTEALHANQIDFAGLYQCRFGIVGAGGRNPLQVTLLDLEHATTPGYLPAWMLFDPATCKDVSDPNHYIVGDVTWWISQDGQNTSVTFTKQGAANLSVRKLGAGIVLPDPEPEPNPDPDPPPPGTVVIQDAFSGTGTLNAGHVIAPTNTVNATWQAVNGAFALANGVAVNQVAGGSQPIAWVDAHAADVDIAVTLRFSGAANGEVVLRASDAQNLLLVDIDSNAGDLSFWRLSGGMWTKLPGNAAVFVPLGVDVPLQVVAHGNQISATALGQTITLTASFNQNATNHGLRTGNNAVTFDDFTVKAL